MKKTILSVLAVLALAGSFAPRAQATVVSTATPTYLGGQFIAAPPSGSVTILKALTVTNDTASSSCAYLYNSSTVNTTKANLALSVCAASYSTVYWPTGAAMDTYGNSYASAAQAFFGELFTFSGIVTINSSLGAVDSTKQVGMVTASYAYQALR